MGIMAGIQENEVEATILTSYDLASQNYINNLRKHQKSNKSTKKTINCSLSHCICTYCNW
jgi:hypothetical protein